MGILHDLMERRAAVDCDGRTDEELVGMVRSEIADGYVRYARAIAQTIKHPDLRAAMIAAADAEIKRTRALC